jgi:hypothetical protein
MVYTYLINVHTSMYQVLLINKAIDAAKPGSTLYKLPHVADPSDEIVEVLIQCMEWNIASRQSGIPESELPELQQKAVDLLDLLTKNLPDKTGEKAKWNFEKAHSILHKVREIVLWGNSDNTSCQAPEVNTNVYVHTMYTDIHVCVMNIVCTDMFLQCTLHFVLNFN